MHAEQVIAHHVKLARKFNHELVQANRLKKPLARVYTSLRDDHMDMARAVKSLARSAFLFECM